MTFTIDAAACTRCGDCERDCPSSAVARSAGSAFSIDAALCIRCGHCAAVCPVDAVRTDAGAFGEWRAPELAPEAVAALIRGKRSVRRYRDEAVPQETLDELLRTGSLASTASNVQDCSATVLRGEGLARCREGVREAFALAARLLRFRPLRLALLLTEARRYVLSPRGLEPLDRLAASGRGGPDRLFFSAPVVVVLSAPRAHARFGRTDCVLAGAHMMLHAESLGLGSCMVGFAETVLNLRPRLRRTLGIPAGDRVHLVFTLGARAVRYRRLPVRRSILTEAEG